MNRWRFIIHINRLGKSCPCGHPYPKIDMILWFFLTFFEVMSSSGEIRKVTNILILQQVKVTLYGVWIGRFYRVAIRPTM